MTAISFEDAQSSMFVISSSELGKATKSGGAGNWPNIDLAESGKDFP